MKFQYACKVHPGDFFVRSMSHTYHSLAGVVNIVFTFAMLALAVAFWNKVPDWVQLFMVLAIAWFPVIQPLMLFFQCKSQVAAIPVGLTLTIDDQGVLVAVGEQQELIKWNRVKGLILERNMVILKVDGQSGYFLPNRVLKKDREELVKFLEAHIA